LLALVLSTHDAPRLGSSRIGDDCDRTTRRRSDRHGVYRREDEIEERERATGDERGTARARLRRGRVV